MLGACISSARILGSHTVHSSLSRSLSNPGYLAPHTRCRSASLTRMSCPLRRNRFYMAPIGLLLHRKIGYSRLLSVLGCIPFWHRHLWGVLCSVLVLTLIVSWSHSNYWPGDSDRTPFGWETRFGHYGHISRSALASGGALSCLAKSPWWARVSSCWLNYMVSSIWSVIEQQTVVSYVRVVKLLIIIDQNSLLFKLLNIIEEFTKSNIRELEMLSYSEFIAFSRHKLEFNRVLSYRYFNCAQYLPQ